MRLRTLAGVIVGLAITSTARADTIETFNVDGTGTVTSSAYFGMTSPSFPVGSATGSLTMDTTTGTILAFALSCSDDDFSTSASLSQVTPSSSTYATVLSDYYSFSISDSDSSATNFVNFSSGSFVLEDEGEHGGDPYGRVFQTYEGTISAANTITPEPSSFTLLGTGLLGIAGMLQRRLYKSRVSRSSLELN